MNDGLPSSQIYEIVEDHDGYIWFGTDAGLVRYNGYEFKTYTTEDGLSTNVIFKLCVDEENRIWCIGDDWRLNCISNNKVSCLHKILDLESLGAGIYIELLSLEMRSNQMNVNFSVSSPYNHKNDISGEKYYSSISSNIDRETKTLYGPVESGIYINNDNDGCRISMQIDSNMVVHYNGKPVHEFQNYDLGKFKGHINVLNLNRNIYYTILGKVFKLQLVNDSYDVELVWQNDDVIWDLKKDKQGNIFLSTQNGICKFDNGNWNNGNWIFENIAVSNLHIDQNNGLWVASLYKGLFYSSNSRAQWLSSPSNASINEIHGANGSIFFTNENSEVFELKSNRVIHLLRKGDGFLSLSNPLSLQKIFKLQASDKGYLFNSYSGTKNVFLDYEKRTYIETDITSKNHYFNDSSIVYNIGTMVFTINSLGNTIESTGLDHSFINMTPYVDSCRLVSTNLGVWKYFHPKLNFDKKVKREIKVSELEPYRPRNHFLRLKISDILLLNDSITIFASKQKGCLFENKWQNDKYLSRENGLISNSIHKLYVNENYLVFQSLEGISIQYKNGGIINYNNNNGLVSNDVRDVFIRNDSIWVATDKGISFFPIETELVRNPSKVHKTNIQIDTTSISTLLDTICLEYWQKNVSLSFEAIAYEQEGEINYSYKLEGLDESWGHTDNRTVRYPNMPSGSFNFWVKYQYSDNSWSEPVLLLKISKSKPFWEKIWFLIISGVGVLILFGLISFYLYKRQNRIQQAKLNLLNLERKNLQAQMNPHFTFNTINSIQHFILKNNKRDAIVYLSEFASLMRKTLDYNYTEYISIEEELSFLEYYVSLENKRFDQNFIIEVSTSAELLLRDIKIPSLLIQPLVENVIMHSNYQVDEDRVIKLEFVEKEAYILLRVIDFGQGFKKGSEKRKHKSRGLNIVRSRIEIYNRERYSETDFRSYFTNTELKSGHTVEIKLYKK